MKNFVSPLLYIMLFGLTAPIFAADDKGGITDKKDKRFSDYFKYSGTLVYRYDYRNDSGNEYKRQGYKATVNVAFTPIKDFSVNARFLGGSGTGSYTRAEHYNYTSRGYQDSDFKISLSNLYLVYSGLSNTQIRIGKLGMRTPWTVGTSTIGGENVGEGIIVDNKFGVVETQLGYFNNQNFETIGSSLRNHVKDNGEKINGEENVLYGLVKAKLPYVTFDVGYLDIQDTLDSYTVGMVLKYKFDKLNFRFDARHTNLSFDGNDATNELTKFGVEAKYDIWGAKLAYGFTGDEGGFVAIDSDATGWYQGAFESAAFNLNKKTDSSLLKANINVDVTPKINLSYDFNKFRDHAKNKKDHSWSARVTYKHNKNFDGYFKYDYVGRQSSQGKRARLQLRYKF